MNFVLIMIQKEPSQVKFGGGGPTLIIHSSQGRHGISKTEAIATGSHLSPDSVVNSVFRVKYTRVQGNHLGFLLCLRFT